MLFLTVILLPLLGGLILPLFRSKSDRFRNFYTEGIVILTSVFTFSLLLHRTDAVCQVFSLTDSLLLCFRVDSLSCVFAGLIAVMWPLATLYAFEYIVHEERPASFFAFYTATYGITLALIFAANLFTLYVFFECLSLITLPLVIHKKNPQSIRAGRIYLAYTIGGAALGFVALAFTLIFGSEPLFVRGGILRQDCTAQQLTLLRIVYVLGFIGFAAKAAVFPLHAWLPTVSVAPTPVTSLLHAVAVVNAGAYAVLRLTYDVFGTELLYGTWAQTTVLALSCFTILFGSVMAVREPHLKRRLAWSTVSNLSYMLMGCALMTPDGMVGSLSHLVLHGFMKITLFNCAGAIIVQTGKEYVRDIRGYAAVMPLTCTVFTVASVALLGVPPLCGFISKWNLLTAAADTGLPMGIVAIVTLILAAILTAVYLFSVVFPMYFRPLNAEQADLRNTIRDPGWRMQLPMLFFALSTVLLGICSSPLITFLRQVAGEG